MAKKGKNSRRKADSDYSGCGGLLVLSIASLVIILVIGSMSLLYQRSKFLFVLVVILALIIFYFIGKNHQSSNNINKGSYIYDENLIDSMEGHEFENYCSNLLKHNGFSRVQVTPGSGDKGIDIFAYKDNQKYGIQCKRSQKSIGTKAIQEVIAGKSYYNCDIAAVLTNNTFTDSAIDYANKTGVLLWDKNILKALHKNLK